MTHYASANVFLDKRTLFLPGGAGHPPTNSAPKIGNEFEHAGVNMLLLFNADKPPKE